MSYDDDLDAIPSLCDACFAKLQATDPTAGIGWKVLVFKCVKCKTEFCPHLEGIEFSRTCLDCTKGNANPETDKGNST